MHLVLAALLIGYSTLYAHRCSKYEGGKALEVAFIGYRDYDDRKRLEVIEFTGDLASFKARVSAVRARGGEPH